MSLKESISAYDKSDMLSKLTGFAEQIRDALRRAQETELPHPKAEIRQVVVAGMGGSAIGGDIVRCYGYNLLPVPLQVVRFYDLPAFVGPHTLVFASSYSGQTEETLSAYRQAVEKGAQVVAITSGGALGADAADRGFPVISIPAGYPPRTALGYLTFPMLVTLQRLGLLPDVSRDIEETIGLVEGLIERYRPNTSDNEAIRLAEQLLGKLPLVYASVVPMEAVAMRWKGQFSENSKMLAWANTFPELNHNEIVGWGQNRDLQSRIQVIYLRDRLDHQRVQLRMDITSEILVSLGQRVLSVDTTGTSVLARMFSLIVLGDFVSYYLAILNRVDPTPIENIDLLKKRMKEATA